MEMIHRAKYEKYTAYKDSGVERFEEIPEDWKILRLCFLGRFSSSGIDKHSKKNESIVKIINFKDIFSNEKRLINSDLSFMVVTTNEENRIKNLVKKGDLIFLPSSETYEDLGLSALVDEHLNNVSFSYHVVRFQFNKTVDHSFKRYITNNYSVLIQFAKAGKGTTRKIIGRQVFNSINVIIPPLNEQTAIANFLDEKTIKIDKAIAQKEKLIELLKERKQIIIQNTVTKGLDSNVNLKDSGVYWIGEIPEHWDVVANRILFKERNESGKEGLPLLSVSIHSAVSTGELDEDENVRGKIKIENKSNYKYVEVNDIVFNMMRAWQGAIGAVSIEGMVSPAYIVAKPNDKIAASFFEYQYRTDQFIQQMNRNSKGITDFRKRLYWDEFKQLKTVLPPKSEQSKIIEYIKLVSDKIDKVITLQQTQIEKLKEYKTTLIDSAVTGKIKVC